MPDIFGEDKINRTATAMPRYSPRAWRRHGLAKLEPRPLSVGTSAHLDLIRGFAAWAVMWGHLRALFFVDFQHIEHTSSLLRIVYFLTGFGHEAVMVFFVLSGFFISSAVISRRVSGNWCWRDYAIDRSSRLYVVLIPALLLGWLWDSVGSSIFASTGIYSRPLDGFGTAIAQNRVTPGIFIGNLLFLQTIVCPTFGSNGPLWSLANEFWYYMLFPVVLAAGMAWRASLTPRAILLTIFAVCLAIFLGSEILVGFLIWLAGAVLVFAYSNCEFSGKPWLILYFLASSLALSACLRGARTGNSAVLGSDLAVGFAFSLFLFGVLQMDMGIGRGFYPRIAHAMAGFSYSLYVLHFPLLLLLRAWIVPPPRWQPDVRHLGYGAIVGAVTISFAWFVSIFTENKTRVARQLMRNVIPRFDG
jgi:peptidoglycan/LPS O-acetylase OafA/YrhL